MTYDVHSLQIPMMIVEHIKRLKTTPPQAKQALVPSSTASSTAQTHRATWRKFWLKLHLYIGLGAGGLFVLSSLTGSLLVFYKTIDEWLNPEQLLVRRSNRFFRLNTLSQQPKAYIPNGRPWRTSPILFIIGTHFRPGFEFQRHFFHITLASRHSRSLQRPRVRRAAMGRLLCVSRLRTPQIVAVGRDRRNHHRGVSLHFVLFPWVQGFISGGRPLEMCAARSPSNQDRSTIRRQYDLHKLSGISGALVLLCSPAPDSISSSRSSRPPRVRLMFSPLRDTTPETQPHSTPRSEADRLPVTEAVAIAQRALPNAKVMWIGFLLPRGRCVYGRTAPTG